MTNPSEEQQGALKLATSLKSTEQLPNVNAVQFSPPSKQAALATEKSDENSQQLELSDSCQQDKITEEPSDMEEQTVQEFFNSE